jgi:hypothetical protein
MIMDHSLYYHNDVRNVFDIYFPRRWVGQRGGVKYPPQSPNLIPLDFYLWGTLTKSVYSTKPRKLKNLKHEVEIACSAFPPQQYKNCSALITAIVKNMLVTNITEVNIFYFFNAG